MWYIQLKQDGVWMNLCRDGRYFLTAIEAGTELEELFRLERLNGIPPTCKYDLRIVFK